VGGYSTGQRGHVVLLFIAFFVATALWSTATPLWASPDENAHVLKAWSVAHGQLYVPPAPTSSQTPGYLQVPSGLNDSAASITCLRFRPEATADCILPPDGAGPEVTVANSAARYNPVYYLVVGIPSLLLDVQHALLAMRLVSAALFALFAAWTMAALASARRPRVAVGVGLLAFTPMTFFLGAVVNPNGLEIAASCALWTNLIMLVQSRLDVSRGTSAAFLRRAALSACAMVATRGLSPVWLLVIVIACLLMADQRGLQRLRDRRARWWLGAVACVSAFSVLWILLSGSLTGTTEALPEQHGLLDRLEIARTTQDGKWRMAIANFGWLDTALPDFWTSGWLVLCVIFAVLAFLRGTAGQRVALAFTGLAAYVLPIIIEAMSLNATGVIWQGRYTLPLYVGVPLLSAIVLGQSSRSLRGDVVMASPVAALSALAALSAVGINDFAYVYALHRNIDGLIDHNGIPTAVSLQGEWQPWLGGVGSASAFAVWTAVAVAGASILTCPMQRPSACVTTDTLPAEPKPS
jgi:Predicted membrane protein (DUF2142)